MFVEIDGVKAHYTDEGEGKPVVLMHGWGSSLDAFVGIRRALCDRFRVIALDFPGFGKSDSIAEPWDVSDYVAFFAKFLQELQVETPVLIGHSFGGRVILKGVGSGLIKAEKIVLIDSAGVKHKRSLRAKCRIAAFKTVKWCLLLPGIRKVSAGTLEKARRHFGSADYNSAPVVLRQTLVKVVNEDLCDYMPNIACPTLLIWGDQDKDTPLADAKIMESKIPDSGLCVIKGAGHFSFIHSPFEVNAILNSFLGGEGA
ncbi:MAG: alpha/beta hydrolase [Clostridia bacterium]|nr:alpha/beta hydrolase [Clostridia bacterium]